MSLWLPHGTLLPGAQMTGVNLQGKWLKLSCKHVICQEMLLPHPKTFWLQFWCGPVLALVRGYTTFMVDCVLKLFVALIAVGFGEDL